MQALPLALTDQFDVMMPAPSEHGCGPLDRHPLTVMSQRQVRVMHYAKDAGCICLQDDAGAGLALKLCEKARAVPASRKTSLPFCLW